MPKQRKAGFLAVLVLAVIAFLAVPVFAAIPGNGRIVFEVLREGSPMGEHRMRFEERGEDLHVFIEIDLEVKLAFVTVFRYEHSNHEVWRDGKLVSIDTTTNDDGEEYFLRGRATELGFEIENRSGSEVLPSDILPSSYWRPETAERSQLLDTQKGRLIDVETRELRQETITVAGARIPATRHRMTGDLNIDIWYAMNGELVKTAFEARGSEVEYARKNISPQLTKLAIE